MGTEMSLWLVVIQTKYVLTSMFIQKKANSVDIQCAHKTKPTWQSVTESQTQLALLEVNQDPSRRDPEQHGIKPLATAAQSAT
jgi:hypothetical protein